ncbi:MAG: hypothetical protein ACK58L_02075 [Planctomycetota bacterium]
MKTAPFSRWIVSNVPFRNSSLTFCSMLLCIFASVLGLVSASSDQTGFSAAAITHEFRKELGMSRQSREEVTDRNPSEIIRFASLRQDARQVDDLQRQRMKEEDELFSWEDAERPDDSRRRDACDADLGSSFQNFVREVERLGHVSQLDLTESHAVIDVFSSSASTDIETSERMAWLIRSIHESVKGHRSGAPMEYRITLWSPAPSLAAIQNATERACMLEKSLSRHFDGRSLSGNTVSVECVCWMLPDSPRPDYSVQAIRRQP